MFEYNKKVLDLFRHPKNMGSMKNPDGIGRVGNAQCGDIMEMYIRVKDNKLKEIKVKTFGCIAAISTSSVLTEMAKGKTLEEAEKMSSADVAKTLGGLPPVKMHCSNLAADALKKAIDDYRKKKEKS